MVGRSFVIGTLFLIVKFTLPRLGPHAVGELLQPERLSRGPAVIRGSHLRCDSKEPLAGLNDPREG